MPAKRRACLLFLYRTFFCGTRSLLWPAPQKHSQTGLTPTHRRSPAHRMESSRPPQCRLGFHDLKVRRFAARKPGRIGGVLQSLFDGISPLRNRSVFSSGVLPRLTGGYSAAIASNESSDPAQLWRNLQRRSRACVCSCAVLPSELSTKLERTSPRPHANWRKAAAEAAQMEAFAAATASLALFRTLSRPTRRRR